MGSTILEFGTFLICILDLVHVLILLKFSYMYILFLIYSKIHALQKGDNIIRKHIGLLI